MLTGRVSLIRLIGKRRRFLPNRQFILADPPHLENSNHCEYQTPKADCKGKEVDEAPNPDWVKCPVCGEGICGDDGAVNIHLDKCLVRGTKRKLTQRTLFQLNFSASPKPEIESTELISSVSVGAIRKDGRQKCSPPVNLKIKNSSVLDSTVKDDVIKEVQTHSILSQNGMSTCDIVTAEIASQEILQAFIVGRRFSNVKDIHQGQNICLLRDPNNTKDPNAIKVISADTDSYEVLGFLPRELSQHLSPLMDKFCLSLKGHVVNIPSHSLDAVPIQILCQNLTSCDQESLLIFESLWQKVLHTVVPLQSLQINRTKYQHNFCLLLKEVLQNYCHLFMEDEKNLLESFTLLSDNSQRLFIRLYMRKGPWFRVSNISYSEISNTHEAAKELCEMGYFCSVDSSNELLDGSLQEILDVLTVSELREIWSILVKKGHQGCVKQEIVTSLISSYKDRLCILLPKIMEKTGVIIKVSSVAECLIWRCERLFFLNGEQDLTAFLLVHMGIIKYPTYRCLISDQVFASRTDLLAYEEALEVAQVLDDSLDGNDVQSVLKCIRISESHISRFLENRAQSSASESVASFLTCFSAPWVYSKVALLGVSVFEKERRYKDAINLLKKLLAAFICDGRRGYWTLRLSVDLEHVGHLEESLIVAEEGSIDPWVRAGSRVALQRRIIRLGKPPRRWKVPEFSVSIKRKIPEVQIQGRPLNCEIGAKNRFYGEDGEQCGVEQLSLQYYAGDGGDWQGIHTESGIWLTIFGLLMWDIIFSDVSNVFRTRFQTAPLDLEADSFYISRKDLIETHLQRIYDGGAEEILIMSWESHMGTSCRGVKWDRHSLAELRAAVTCIGGPSLALMCRHLAQDYRSWSSGMPDLLLWRFHSNYSGEAKLVEVKGPRDRLSEQQRAWLLFLMDCGFTVEICKVSPLLGSS